MIFRTQIPVKKTQFQIDYDSRVLLFGSCFTENIGNKLDYFKFENTINPFGILFHPIAIENLIANAINQKKYTEKDLFFHKEQWHCFDAHSILSNSSKVVLLQQLNSAIKLTNKQINESTHVVITLGTSWIYRFIETDTIVANCHKVLQKKFLKELLIVEKIAESIEAMISLVKSVNKKTEIIFTVSPVRHLKDGFTENSLSKAHLISAIHQVVEPQKSTHYFASYEMMIDDLRDYRFYKNDMLHPNETAINYIWQQFKNTWINEKSFDLMNEIDIIQKGLLHKPFHGNSTEHQQFLSQLNRKIDAVTQKHPQIKF